MAEPSSDNSTVLIMNTDNSVEEKVTEDGEDMQSSCQSSQSCESLFSISSAKSSDSNSKSGPVLRPPQLGGSQSPQKSLFSLNPSKLNSKVLSSDNSKSESASDRSDVNGTLKFVPLINSEKPEVKSVKTTTNSHNFVFGQNLQERVIADGKADDSKPSSSCMNENGTSDMLFTTTLKESGTPKSPVRKEKKSLSESAREYEELRAAVKRKYEEVQVKTGEEGETNIIQMSCKLFAYDKSPGSWQERGRGILRLNDLESTDSCSQSRLVFRTAGSLRVILNTKIWADMTIQEASGKSIRLTAIDNNGEIKVFLIMGTPEEIKQLFKCLETRVANERQKLQKPDSDECNPNKLIKDK